MRHRKQKFTLGRERHARLALLRQLADSLVLHGSIETTYAKARALRTVVEPLITKAKHGTLADRRNILRVVYTERAVQKLMNELGPRYKTRSGGYTRILKQGRRAGDRGETARIEFV